MFFVGGERLDCKVRGGTAVAFVGRNEGRNSVEGDSKAPRP